MRIGLIDGDVLHHASMWKAETVDDYLANLDTHLMEWTEWACVDSFKVAVNNPKIFRFEVYPDYKKTASREASRAQRGELESECKAILHGMEFTTIAPEGLEADDQLAIWSVEETEDTPVVITVDKDLQQIAGSHFNTYHMASSNVKPYEALRCLQFQLITGDSMDKIPGLPRMGPVKAEKALSLGIDPLDLYKQVHGDNWEKEFLFNGKLLYLLRSVEDEFSIERYEQIKKEAQQGSLDTLPV
jgi:hypothetical protein